MVRNKKTLKNDESLKGKINAGSSSKTLTAKEISEKYTIAELKSILKENGLKVSGKKQDLVERVLPILNENSAKEDVSNDTESKETEELISGDNELLIPALDMFGINYEELSIEDQTIMGDNTNLKIYGFTQKGLSMSDYTMSLKGDLDSSNVDLKMNIPEVSYTDFENTIFTFKDLELSILPSSDPQTLEFSAVMDSLEIITESNYVNLKGLNLIFKSFPDKGVCLDIDIDRFIYPDFDDTSITFENLGLNISFGLNGEMLSISTKLPKLNLLNKNYRIKLSDLNLNINLPDANLSDLDLTIFMSDFHYTNFDNVHVDMENVDVSNEPIISDKVNIITRMDYLDAAGLNSFDELFPMLNITGVNIKTPATDSESPVTINSVMPLLDISKVGLFTIIDLLITGFDLDTYMSNLPGQFKATFGSYADISSADDSGFDIANMFKNLDISGLSGIKLDLTGLLDSVDINLSDFGIDASDYDLSDISLPELIGVLKNSEFVMTAIGAITKLSSIDFDKLDFSGLISSFDTENFDMSSLLASLNLSDLDIPAIMDKLGNFTGLLKNLDLSCLGAIELNLTGLLDSVGIDLSDLGIDLSGYDLSAISLTELIGLLSKLEIDMDTLKAMLQLFGVELDGLDLNGIISNFDTENFDLSSLLESLNLSGSNLADIMDMFTNSDIDFKGMLENLDLSCLGAIELNLTGLIVSLGIDISDLGIDLSDYDLSKISLAELIGIISNLKIDMNTITALLRLSDLKLDNLDFDGMISNFDAENFDMSSLLGSLNLSDSDIDAITGMFTESDIDFEAIFKNCDYSTLDGMVLDLTGVIDSLEIDVSELGVDLKDYDLSSITIAELAGILSNPDLDMAAITSKFDASSLEKLDMKGMVSSFDEENFDISSLLESLNLSGMDISAMADMFTNSDIDFEGIFKNIDLSCLGAIELNLGGLIVSLGIDISDLGIDLSDYDLSKISLAELIGIISKVKFDMDTMLIMLKLFGIELDNLDLEGLISNFDAENFDLTSLLKSLNLSDLDITALVEMYNDPNMDFGKMFENFDYSSLGAIELNLTGLLDSADIDLSDFGIDASGYDLSKISLAEFIDVLSTSEFIMTADAALSKLLKMDFDNLDMSGLISSFDAENFDVSGLLESLDQSTLDVSGIFGNFDMNGFDLAEFMNNSIGMLIEKTFPKAVKA